MRPFLFTLLAAATAVASPPEQKTSAKGLTYSVRVPDKHVRGRHVLVVGLHGAGDNCANFMRWLDGGQSTVPKDVVLVVPQAQKDGSWEANDLEPLAALVRDAQAEFQPTRTLCMGFSRGAFYTFHLTFSHPDLFQGAIPCAGGLPGGVPDSEELKSLPFYVIHGDADAVVPVKASEDAVKALEAKSVLHKFEKVAGLKHTMDWAALKRGLDWIHGILDERDKAAEEAIAGKLGELEKLLKEKAWPAAAEAMRGITKVPRRLAPRLAVLVKPHVQSAEEELALAAIEASGRCGADGIAALKGIPVTQTKLATAAATALGAGGSPAAADPLLTFLKANTESVAVAAAVSLAQIGGDQALKNLISGLVSAEGRNPQDGRTQAILDALKSLTGQSFAKSGEWKKWLSARDREAGR